MLSIIVPVRNESENSKVFLTILMINLKQIDFEVLIINDF